MTSQRFWVYIMGGAGQSIYIGMSNNLSRRVWEHKNKQTRGYTAKYNLDRLLFYVEFNNPNDAIVYEKKIKGWVRRKKQALIDEMNPTRQDLAKDWFHTEENTPLTLNMTQDCRHSKRSEKSPQNNE